VWARVLAVAVLAAAAAGREPEDLLRVDGRRPDAVVVARGAFWDRTLPLDTPMGRFAAGVYARYEGRAVDGLLRCATRQPLPDAAATRIAVLHLSRRDVDEPRLVELLRLAGGTVGARALDDTGAAVRLDAARFAALEAAWPAYRGGLDPPRATGTSMPMDRPFVKGAVTMDERTMKQRLYRGMPVLAPSADRDLGHETLHARLPAGYDPRHPAGLLVWCSPTPEGSIPGPLSAALDELGLVCVAAENAGNDRDVPDKFQLVFDAIATARQRYHVDDARVYIAGLSGGAKVASILAICFPEHFAGAVPIVGFATYATLDESWGRHRAAYFARPREGTLAEARRLRLGLLGGPADFNYEEMLKRSALLEADGFEHVHFFTYPDMAHRMPTPERFAEALRWVDEPYWQRRNQQITKAESLLAVGPWDEATLHLVIETAPWSDAAWQALERMRGISP
jgi:predicted esterase